MQLARVLLGGREPALQAAFEPGRWRAAGGLQEGVDRQVITHRITLHQAPHAADVVRPTVAQLSRGGEAHLVPAQSLEVGLQGYPAREIEAIRIGQVEKGFGVGQRKRFELDAVVAGSHRPIAGVKRDVEIIRGHGGHAVGKVDP